jgi:hypothetical protein
MALLHRIALQLRAHALLSMRTHLVQLLLIHVVVVVRLRRHRGMRTPHSVEGAHQAEDVPPLPKDWSKSGWINEIMKTHSAAYGRSYRKH